MLFKKEGLQIVMSLLIEFVSCVYATGYYVGYF